MAQESGEESYDDFSKDIDELLEEDFQEVEPLSEGLDALGYGKYSKNDPHRNIFDLFRRILHLEEFSKRGFYLSMHCIEVFPSMFTAYKYRRDCIKKKVIKIHPMHELNFMDKMMEESPKNFQILDHKKMFVEMSKKWKPEIQFVKNMFNYDAKNYHAWAYLIWLCEKFSLYEELKPMMEEMIDEDVGNSSRDS